MTVTVTGTVRNVAGVPDRSKWTFSSVLRQSGDGDAVVSPNLVVATPNTAGLLTVELDPGLVVVKFGNTVVKATVPDVDEFDLWDLISVGILLPPTTPDQKVAAAVAAYWQAYPADMDMISDATTVGKAVVRAASQAAARSAIGAIDAPMVNLITSAVNVEREATGVDWTDGAEVRTTLQGVMNQAVVDGRRVRFPDRDYLLGVAGGPGSNQLLIPSRAKLEFDSGAYLQINQVDSGTTVTNVRAAGTESAKVNLTVDAVAGARTVTLPSGQGANFAVGDMIALESRAVVTPNISGVTGVGYARQLFLVEYIGGDVVRLDRPLWDSFLTADGAQFSKITPARDIVIDGMKFTSGPGVALGTDAARLLRLERTLNARLGNIELHNTIGGVFFFDSMDFRVDGLYADRLPRKSDHGGYVCAVEGASVNWTINGLVGREFRHLFSTLFDTRVVHTGTVVAATSTTVTLASGASSTNNFYVGASVVVFGGGAQQVKIITAYNGTTKVATVDSAWSPTPSNAWSYTVATCWGNPEHGSINASKGYAGLGATSVFDTHEAGRHISFNDCEAYGSAIASEPTGEFAGLAPAGAQIRSSYTYLSNFRAHRMGREGVNFTRQSRHCVYDGGSAGYNAGNGITLKGASNAVRNVDVHHSGGGGVIIDADSFDCFVENVRAYENSFHGIRDYGSTRTVIKGGSIPKSTAQPFSIYQLSATSRAEDVSCLGYGAGASGLTDTVAGALYRLFTDTDIRTNMPLVVNGSAVETTANRNAINGYAGLGADGKVAAAQLPSYVDDVLEVANFAALPATGETGKIYLAQDTGHGYRWSGSAYIDLSALELLSILTSDNLIMQRKSGAVVGRTPSQVKTDLAIVPADVGALSMAKGYTSGSWYGCGLTGQATAAALTLNRIAYQPWIVTEATTIAQLLAEFTVAGSADSYVRVGIYADTGAGKPGALIAEAGSISTGTGNAGTVATGGTPGAYVIPSLSIAVPFGLVWVATKMEGTSAATLRVPSTAAQIPPNLTFGTATPVAAQQTGVYIETGVAGNALPANANSGVATTTPQGARVLFKAA